ncbi:MAG TPA: hypothetical protein VGH43_19640 [Jatrophihabitans sp.]|jgi:hypothetical protein
MASIEKRLRNGQVRWYVRYRDPAGLQHTRTFNRKVDAERYLTTTEASKLAGTYIDPAAARLTVGLWARRWLDNQTHLKPSTRERYAGIVRSHIERQWGSTRLADVTHSAVQAWVSELARTRSLGHKSATMTLDLYGHLFPDQLDEVAERLDRAARDQMALPTRLPRHEPARVGVLMCTRCGSGHFQDPLQ